MSEDDKTISVYDTRISLEVMPGVPDVHMLRVESVQAESCVTVYLGYPEVVTMRGWFEQAVISMELTIPKIRQRARGDSDAK